MYVHLDENQKEQDNNLGSYLFDDKTFVNAIIEIKDALNYNACDGNPYAPWNFSCRIVDYSQVEKVVKAYMRIVVDDDDFPEFNPQKLENKDKLQEALLSEVAKKSGIIEDKSKKVLRQLYYYTLSGVIVDSSFLYPRTNGKDLSEYEDVGIAGAVKNVVSTTGTVLKNLGTGVGQTAEGLGWLFKNLPYVLVGVAVIAGIKYYPEFKKSIKGK